MSNIAPSIHPDIFSTESRITSSAGSNKLLAQRHLHCWRLLGKFAKSGHITCRISSHVVNIKQAGGISSHGAICHAGIYCEKPLFRCRRCQKSIHVMSSVYRHMKEEHGVTKGAAKEYDELSNDCQQKILDALTNSFDWSQGSIEENGDEARGSKDF